MTIAGSIRSGIARCAAAGAAVLVLAAPAAAVPLRQDAQFPLPALGLTAVQPFDGRDDVVALVVPVPPGMAPAALRGTLQVAPDAGTGRIDVEVQGRVVGSVEVPPGSATLPVSLPLAGVPVLNGAATVTLHSHLTAMGAGWCAAESGTLALVDATVDYTGEETQPAVIADFLPPVLNRLTLYLPATPSADETATALELGTAIVARYANQTVAVELRPLGPGGAIPAEPPGLLERRVVITEADTAGTTLRTTAPGGPVLAVTGRGAELRTQARLITSDMAWIAADTAAVAGSLAPAPQLAPDSVTLRELGVTTLSGTGQGRVRIPIAVDQTRLGRPSGTVRIHLRGNYTPLPDGTNGQLTATVGDSTVDHWPVDGSGSIDRWIDVPDRLLGRFTEVAVALQVAGAASCEAAQPVTLTLDPESTVESVRRVPPVPGGFEALPQALMPAVQVGLSAGTLADAGRALGLLTGLQRMTLAPLRPELVPLDAALNSDRPAVLIAADGGLPDSLELPLTVVGPSVTVADADGGPAQSVELPGQRLGSLQAAWSGDRMLLVATSTGDPAATDRLLDWLRAEPDRWYGLRGGVLAQTGDREPILLQAPATLPAEQPSDDHTTLLLAGAVLLGIGLIGAVLVLLTRARRGPGRRA
ncbi:cellulose biosynthesis cyclic di-GMP-binding regulatory protein BcsB [Nocardia asteroides]|uniref:cellulose biosynthesis cyclic di-GMP-binding regulatory protein BcsB n=1 Tax=Nocardia asteroides TaxID=1824 RepID=UPI001E4B93C9|nr:cellulose biosynthesis cyclic di-GMP-binding regulatory protein BcsB [Nocardia asteroides]UGT60739.1 cellulose biosynthesis cyclic di-GMP-binding regulatory protein BcsB [Nocardia asteroides]